jgi:O-antigen ligase
MSQTVHSQSEGAPVRAPERSRREVDPGRPEPRAENERLRRALLVAAVVCLAVLPIGGVAALRSVALATATLLALAVLVAARGRRAATVPSPGAAILVPLVLWALWASSSLLWSHAPAYTLRELRAEFAWSLATMTVFYVAADGVSALRALMLTVLAGLALMTGLSLALAPFGDAFAAGTWHGGVGAYATYLVLAAPVLILLLAPPPAGFRGPATVLAAAVLLCALLLAAARLTDNRMVWIAFAAIGATAAVLAGLRWRAAVLRAPVRWLAPVAMLLVALAVLFADAAREKARVHFPPDTSVVETIERDPRLQLWNRTAALIAERPWTGYGFGKEVLRQELRNTLGDPTLSHAHNIFISQWLQTGAVGLALLVALLGAIGWRYVRFCRSTSDTLALLGVVGLSLLAGFIVKNLTDDFLIRSNGRLFWALNAAILGWGIRQERAGR